MFAHPDLTVNIVHRYYEFFGAPFADQKQVERAVSRVSAVLRMPRRWLGFDASPKVRISDETLESHAESALA